MNMKGLVSVGSLALMLAASVMLGACADTRAADTDPAIAAIYADADARAAQKRAQQLRLTATEAANATATAVFAPMAAQTQAARETETAHISQMATAAPIATAEAAVAVAMAQTATAIPFATATGAAAQTATAAPIATQQVQQMLAAQTAVVAPTATWQAFQLEAARRDSLAKAEQQNAVVSRLLDLAWIAALVILVVAGVIIVGRQFARVMAQTTLARASAATSVEQARAATQRERQKAEDAKARAAHARPPVYVIEEHAASASERNLPNASAQFVAHTDASRGGAQEHGDDDIHFIWEMQLDEPTDSSAGSSAGSLDQTRSIIIDGNHVADAIEDAQLPAHSTTQSTARTTAQTTQRWRA